MSVPFQDFSNLIPGMRFKQRTVKDQSGHSVGAECSFDRIHIKYFVHQFNKNEVHAEAHLFKRGVSVHSGLLITFMVKLGAVTDGIRSKDI